MKTQRYLVRIEPLEEKPLVGVFFASEDKCFVNRFVSNNIVVHEEEKNVHFISKAKRHISWQHIAYVSPW